MAENYLKIDDDALSQAESSYKQLATDMTTLKDTLNDAVKALKSGWDSDGGKAFFKKFDEQWLCNMEDYSAVIEHMGVNMSIANKHYQPVFEKAKNLNVK